METNDQTVIVGGIPTVRLSRPGLVELLLKQDSDNASMASKLLFDVNGHGLALSLFDKTYRQDLFAADVVHADGQPLVIASRFLTKSPLPERTATTDMFHDVADAAQRQGKTFFLLGGTDEVVQACRRRMIELYPDLRIVGIRSGYFSLQEEMEVCDEINESGADIVWVGLGKPKEQAFCVRNRSNLSAAWLVTCGGCFNYVTGHYARAPDWMQKGGVEWIHRLLTQPRKLWWRYVSTTPVALFLLLTRTGGTRSY
jgi:exopolysaccharide biosynthesis WecB/TagA/CpsF family protein